MQKGLEPYIFSGSRVYGLGCFENPRFLCSGGLSSDDAPLRLRVSCRAPRAGGLERLEREWHRPQPR